MNSAGNEVVVDERPAESQLLRAGRVLDRCDGVVVLDGVVTLRPSPREIACEVVDPAPDSRRCAEEFKVLVENAQRRLAASKLAARLPTRPLRWAVVAVEDDRKVQLWP